MKQVINYWIHGPKGSGKTALGYGIAPATSEWFNPLGIRALSNALNRGRYLVIDLGCINASHPSTTTRQKVETEIRNAANRAKSVIQTNVNSFDYSDIYQLIIISEHLPEDDSLTDRFTVIRITPPSRPIHIEEKP